MLGKIVNTALKPLGLQVRRTQSTRSIPMHASDDERSLVTRFSEYTMTSPERQIGLIEAVWYLDRKGVAGDFVECGVWRGGSMMLAIAARDPRPSIGRRYHLFDTFTGMSKPTEADVRIGDGQKALEIHASRDQGTHNSWAYASLEDVQASFRKEGFSDESLIWHVGKVEDTLADPSSIPEKIALLRLDTDWYESTLLELEVLYPRLQNGGILIIDDYGSWAGARKAVDEYFEDRPVLLSRLDGAGRLVVKV